MNIFKKIVLKLRTMMTTEVKPLSYDEKRAIINGFKEKSDSKILVETGTFLGDTVEFFKSRFEKVYSIELADELAKKAIERFKNDENVRIVHGDSGVEIATIIKNERTPIVFWLDGHYSSEFQMGDEWIVTGRTDKDTPVEQELQHVFSDSIDHIVLIDDARLFVGRNDYPTIEATHAKIESLKPGKYNFEVKDDIIRIYPKIILI
jgi:hypothetical protein